MPRPITYPAKEAAKNRQAPEEYSVPESEPTEEEMKEEFMQEKVAKFAEEKGDWLINAASGKGICFYPASGSLNPDSLIDIEPVRTFSHLCDTFVFCDHYPDFKNSTLWLSSALFMAIQELGARLSRPWTGYWGEPFRKRQEVLDDLASPANLPDHFQFRDAVPDRLFRWEDQPEMNRLTTTAHVLHYAPVYRHIGGFERELHLYFFDIEGVTLYWNLFARRNIAPEVLCLKRVDRHHRNWTQFRAWNQALGRCVEANPAKPRIVCAGCPSETDWPWKRRWQSHSDWEGAISWVRQDEPTPIIERDSRVLEGIVSVEIWVGPLPEGIKTLERSSDTPTLLYALDKLPETTKLEIAIEGFADEGCSLIEWRQHQTKPRSLIIYCTDQGQIESFGPYADAVEFHS